MKTLEGDRRIFAVINTAEYNSDGQWKISVATADELSGIGFGDDDIEHINAMDVSGISTNFDFIGLIVIRLA